MNADATTHDGSGKMGTKFGAIRSGKAVSNSTTDTLGSAESAQHPQTRLHWPLAGAVH